jgi:membrane protease YdiL (CAAX protease family)
MGSDPPDTHEPDEEPSPEPPLEPPLEPRVGEQPAIDLVRAGLLFYGLMLAVGLVWRMGFYGEPILFASQEAAAQRVRWGRDLGLGVAAGLGVVGVSHVFTEWTRSGEALARALAGTIGVVAVPDLLLLAMASGLGEELLFRGALQPRVGLVWASLLFGCVHFVPRREFLPWTIFAILAGFLFGALFAWTGNLIAPVVAHTIVNGVNLPLLVKRYGADAAGDPPV